MRVGKQGREGRRDKDGSRFPCLVRKVDGGSIYHMGRVETAYLGLGGEQELSCRHVELEMPM